MAPCPYVSFTGSHGDLLTGGVQGAATPGRTTVTAGVGPSLERRGRHSVDGFAQRAEDPVRLGIIDQGPLALFG